MSARTVTVQTVDHGAVTLPEPSWCVARHDVEGYREDISHEGAPFPLLVPTDCHGHVETLPVFFSCRPFSASPAVHAVLELDQWHEFSPAGLDRAAAALVEHAATLRAFARQLSVMRGEGL